MQDIEMQEQIERQTHIRDNHRTIADVCAVSRGSISTGGNLFQQWDRLINETAHIDRCS